MTVSTYAAETEFQIVSEAAAGQYQRVNVFL